MIAGGDWLLRRVAESDLVRHTFDLRDRGLGAGEAAETSEALVHAFLLGRCLFFATAVARRVGREHLVVFRDIDGRLLHAVVACAPQFDPRALRGDGVDVLGRMRLSETFAVVAAGGPPEAVRVEIGDMSAAAEFADGEEDRLVALASVLPWTRNFVGAPLASERSPALFLRAVAGVTEPPPSPDP